MRRQEETRVERVETGEVRERQERGMRERGGEGNRWTTKEMGYKGEGGRERGKWEDRREEEVRVNENQEKEEGEVCGGEKEEEREKGEKKERE